MGLADAGYGLILPPLSVDMVGLTVVPLFHESVKLLNLRGFSRRAARRRRKIRIQRRARRYTGLPKNGGPMAKAVHAMLRVFDLERSIDFYSKALGLETAEKFEFDDFTLAYLRNKESAFELELTHNHDQREPYSHGSGYGHIAVTVDDLAAEHRRLSSAGITTRDIVDMKHQGNALARFFFLEDPDGYKIEVIERGGRYV